MIKNELESLLHNKLLLVVLITIMLIPSIYAGLFLSSMWDPYGDLKYLPVAIVNKDKSVEYNGKELSVGESLADELEKSDSMAFNVVDEKTAEDGLRKGTYYMVITIPEDFSENATTLMDENPKKMILSYETNPGTNYIAMKMSESAVKEIKKNISNEITRTYAENVFDSIQEIGDGFGDAIEGTDEMIDGEDKLADGNKKITDNLGTLADSSLTFKEGADKLSKGLGTYTKGVADVDKGVGTLKKGVNTLSDSAVTGSGDLAKGADSLNKGITSYTAGVKSAKEGADKLTANNTALNKGVDSVSAGVKSAKAGSSALYAGLVQLKGMVNAGLTADKETQLKQLIVLLSNYAGVPTPVNDSRSMSAVDKVEDSVSSAEASLSQAKDVLADAKDAEPEEQQRAIDTALNLIDSAKNDLSGSGVDSLEKAVSEDLDRATAGIPDQQTTMAMAASTLTEMMNSTKTLQGVLNSEDPAKSPVAGAYALDQGIGQLEAGINGDNGLASGVKAYTAGAASLNTGLAALAGNNAALTKGAGDLKDGAGKLSTGLAGGVKTLSDGVDKLNKGTNQLVANNNTLINGVSQLSDGAGKISDGAGKLRDGSSELGDGINKLEDGTRTLNTALKDGEIEIRDNKASDATLDMFAEPVDTEGSTMTTVKNNGHAMAAYMMSVGLWVGCIAFCLMYPLADYKELKNGISWWASKAVILYPLAVLMSVILVFILHVVNGFEPENMGRTLLVGVFTSVAFMSLMYLFNIQFGKVGSFMMLIFMVLQLTGSAGTYPVEISGSLVPKIHNWMPFTYTVDAFRSAIAGGESVTKALVVLGTIAVVASVCTVITFHIRAEKIKAGKFTIYSWIEEKGLA